MAKAVSEEHDDFHHFKADDDEVYIPEARRASMMVAQQSAVESQAGGGRRVSSLGSLHHAGHSSWLTASGHLVTAIIGAGVLGLPNAVAWLGWVAGVGAMVLFYMITLWTCTMLTDCYHVKGKRHTRYKWAVLHIMGPTHALILSVCQNLNMFLTTIGYTIAAADSLRYIARLACSAAGLQTCFDHQWAHTIIFGAVQLAMSQLPNLESAWWASAMGAIMSIGYSTIAVALAASHAANHDGTIGGRAAPPMDKTFGIFNSLGNIGFAYSAAIVLMEVEDTLREPPKAEVSMKKSVQLGLGTTFFFYLLISVLGYLALGNAVPDNVLLGFSQSPDWVNMLANAMVLVHMVSAYQVFAQPVFQTIEDWMIHFFPTMQFTTKKNEVLIRLSYRSLFVAFTTFVACLLPFFGAFTGLVGAITFFPTAVAYPILMYMRVKPTTRARRALMWAVFGLMGSIALVATAGSVESIAASAKTFTLFEKP